MKKVVNLNGVKVLDKAKQKLIFGGLKLEDGGGGASGNWACGCNSGVNVSGVPSCNSSNCNWACTNQGGWNGACICVGGGC